jgi:hypothetical protein
MFFQRFILTKYNPLIHCKFVRLLTTSPVQIEFKDGLANITVPLPSRGESCVFQVNEKKNNFICEYPAFFLLVKTI